MMIDSGNSGPCVWMTACIHGDEIAGTVIIQELFKLLKRKIRKGKVHAFPIVNPFGFEQKTRVIPYSKEDLNRLFPGNPDGSLGARIASIIFDRILEDGPALVLDLHNDWIRSIPYTLLDRDFNTILPPAVVEIMKKYAFSIGFPVVMDSDSISGSLSGVLLRKGIPALTLELGTSNFVSEKNIRNGVFAILRLLRSMGMIEMGEESQISESADEPGRILNYSQLPLSSTSGIIRFYTGEGNKVSEGQMIAKIYNAFGKKQETLYAEKEGIVLGCADTSLAFPGFPVMAFGTN